MKILVFFGQKKKDTGAFTLSPKTGETQSALFLATFIGIAPGTIARRHTVEIVADLVTRKLAERA